MIRSWGQKRDEDKGVSQRQTNAGEALRLPPWKTGSLVQDLNYSLPEIAVVFLSQ